jgi:hypothetical protein
MNAYRKLEPGARLPRMKLPQVLDVPESLSAEDFDTLLMAETSNYLTYKNLWKAWCGRDDTLVPAKLAAFLLNARLSGQAAYWARRWKHNGVREEQLMLKKLATCYSNMGQRELFYQTLQRLLDTGYAKSGLKTFERLHGADPRFQELADK